jgi:hypothetical protein
MRSRDRRLASTSVRLARQIRGNGIECGVTLPLPDFGPKPGASPCFGSLRPDKKAIHLNDFDEYLTELQRRVEAHYGN